MCWLRIGVMVAVALSGAIEVVQAQTTPPEPPADVGVRFGPLALSPTIRVTNLGHEGNVFNAPENPTSDFTATVSPTLEAWLQLRRLRVSGRSELDYVYFNRLDQLRSVDTANTGRVELRLNRVTPYVSASFASTRHRRNLEIDARARRRDERAVAGVDVRLTPRTSVDLRMTRSAVSYASDAVYLDSNLARALNRSSTGEGIAVRYALTPLTTLALEVERDRDRFEFAPERNSDSLRVAPTVQFKPLALVSGTASVGIRRRTFHDPLVPAFEGLAIRLDLTYTLLGRTRFGIVAERDLAHSYRITDSDYITTGLTGSVTQRLADPWDVRARISRSRLTYRTEAVPGAAGDAPAEMVVRVGGELGYSLGRTRLAFHVDRYQRQSDVGRQRQYSRLSIASSLTFRF